MKVNMRHLHCHANLACVQLIGMQELSRQLFAVKYYCIASLIKR